MTRLQAPSQADVLAGLLHGLDVLDLEHPRESGAPVAPVHVPGFHYSLHRRHESVSGGVRTSASGLLVFNEHNGTHIDAICHQAEAMCLHGGQAVDAAVQTPFGFTELGAETIPPLLRRGVLLDVAGAAGVERLPQGHVVTADELRDAAAHGRVEVRPGDVVLIRTGTGQCWNDPGTYMLGPGVGADGARWLGAREPVAVGADNIAFDPFGHTDDQLGDLPCHLLLTVRHGIYIIENLWLEDLAHRAASEFVFVCVPLKLRGATGSPVRPLALLPGSPESC